MDKMEFKVKNITHLNDVGKDTQKLIKKIVHELCEDEEKWEGFSNKDIKEADLYVQEYSCFFDAKLEYGEYEGKERLKVFIKDGNDEWHNVGIVPPSIVKEYEEKKKNAVRTSVTIAELTGGKIKKSVNYGESVETVELSYGIKITVDFIYETDIKGQEIISNIKNDGKERYNNTNHKTNIATGVIAVAILIPSVWIFLKIVNFITWLFE